MEAIYIDMNEYTKQKYVLNQCELTFLQTDDIKKVGKSTLHIVNGDSFSLKLIYVFLIMVIIILLK